MSWRKTTVRRHKLTDFCSVLPEFLHSAEDDFSLHRVHLRRLLKLYSFFCAEHLCRGFSHRPRRRAGTKIGAQCNDALRKEVPKPITSDGFMIDWLIIHSIAAKKSQKGRMEDSLSCLFLFGFLIGHIRPIRGRFYDWVIIHLFVVILSQIDQL